LVRSVSEHTYAMLWLVDGGEEAIQALWAGWDDYRDLLNRRTNPEDPPTLEPSFDRPASTNGIEEHERELLNNIVTRLEAYDGADPVSVYQILSSLTHPSLATSSHTCIAVRTV
jgi:hypothetical protein